MRHWLGIFSLLLWASAAIAGAPAPCFRAVSSASGTFLVITDAEFSHSLPAMAKRVTLRVVHGTTHKVFSSNTYWSSDPEWSVVFRKSNSFMSSCPLSLISDDGDYLILLDELGTDSALHIYRRPDRGREGALVRNIALKEIWPERKWQEQRAMVVIGGTPQWFTDGTFEFSSDSRVLIHKTRWGNTVHIHLSDGSVSP